jgi:glycosyltransferase involved in cell wall biosynthesis
MWRLGIPFVFGPVGGGEYAPPALLHSLPWRGRIAEWLRAAANRMADFDPLVQAMFRRATLICCNTPETMERVPARYSHKTICVHDVAVDGERVAQACASAPGPRFLFVGRLLYWKGIHLSLRALALVCRDLRDARLTIVGDGTDRAWLRSLARELAIEQSVDWPGWLPRNEVLDLYAAQTAFVFPSLHDSGGTVVMEAMAQGLPVVCLDLGGPGAILPADCGIKIEARHRTEEQVVHALAEAMKSLASNPALRDELAANSLKAARELTWATLIGQTYEQIERKSALATARSAPAQ